MLGNNALRADVFGYLLQIVKSPFFEGLKVGVCVCVCECNDFTVRSSLISQPVASICKCVLHALLSLCISSFSEESLGNPAVSC